MRYLVTLSALLTLAGCVHGQGAPQPVTVIQPGPLQCVGATSAVAAEQQVHQYLAPLLEAQRAYLCSESAPAQPSPLPPPTLSPMPEAPSEPRRSPAHQLPQAQPAESPPAHAAHH